MVVVPTLQESRAGVFRKLAPLWYGGMRDTLLPFRLCIGPGEVEAFGLASLESLGPPGTKNRKAHRPKGRKVRPIKPCSFTHTSKRTQPLAERELFLLQVVRQRKQVQILDQPLAPVTRRFCADALSGQIEE